MGHKHEILEADILPPAEYARARAEWRRKITATKRNHCVEVGPYVTFYFENHETMWSQVHEMIYIEKGGAEQVPGELEAYNPLVPKGNELVATFMIEIDDPDRRRRILGALGGVEETAFSVSVTRRWSVCRKRIWTAPLPTARHPRCSLCTSRLPRRRSRRSERRARRLCWGYRTRIVVTWRC
jgi:hypothetical protein